MNKVKVGNSLKIPAATWNTLLDVAQERQVRSQNQTGEAQPHGLPAGIVLVKNSSGTDRARFDILGIDGPIFTPTDGEQAFTDRVTLSGILPTKDNHLGRFIILAQPVKAGMVARAWAFGVCPVKVKVGDDAHRFADVADEALLRYGVPPEWLSDVRKSNEDTLLELADHLPGEAAEALLALATGAVPEIAKPVAVDADPFEHPDSKRRFRVMTNLEELQRALDYPWEKWTVFLHPAQRELVERQYSGPACVSGSAGTGKTIVAQMLAEASKKAASHRFSGHFLWTEWNDLVDAWQLDVWEAYRDVARLGRKTRLGEQQRQISLSLTCRGAAMATGGRRCRRPSIVYC